MQDKLENNYSVYQHVTPDGMHYYGQTQNVEQRWSNNGSLYKGTALQPYIEKFGWENIQHIILFENQSKDDALSIENSLIISGWEKGNCINQQRSGNVSKDIREYQREYHREYREENREKYNEYHREYQREYQRQRYQRKKEEKQFEELGYIPLF